MNPYVLIADDNQARVSLCLDVLDQDAVVRTAVSAPDAIRVLDRDGAPALLVVDLLLRDGGGLSVLDALNQVRTRVPVVAWTSSRAARELAGLCVVRTNVRILRSVRPAVLRAAIDRLLPAGIARSMGLPDRLEDVTSAMRSTLLEATRLVGATGAAAYVREAGSTQLRAMIEWTADTPIPQTASWMPYLLDSIMATGRPLVSPDLTTHQPIDAPVSALFEGIRGLAAVPMIADDGQTDGVLCVFDSEPLRVSEGTIEPLVALARMKRTSSPASVERPRDDRFSSLNALSRPTSLLTLLDRPVGTAAIQRELARARRERGRLGVIIFNVDPLASVPGLTAALRASDLAIQWKKDELVIVLTNVASGEARRVAERLHGVVRDAGMEVAVAGGVSELLPHESFELVLEGAEEKMRLALRNGQSYVA
jgi:CheY-like chemotaxis protein